MSVTWTKNQRDAIEARGVSLMVSAAAGSGKTSVLTQRIVSLLSEENGISSSRLAVVTFTKAAAQSLEDKLYRALSEIVAEDPENTSLAHQLMGLSRAQISTIHSFCFSLIRSFQKELGLGEKLRIGDPCRIEPMKKKAIEDAVETFLSEAKGETLSRRREVCRIFGSARSLAGLYDALAILFEKVSCLPGGIEVLKEKEADLQAEAEKLQRGEISFADTSFAKPVIEEAEAMFLRGHETLLALIDPLSHTQVTGEKYALFLEERSEILKNCAALVKCGDLFGAAKTLEDGFASPLPKIVKCPPEEKEIKGAVGDIHNRLKKEMLAFSHAHLKKPMPALLDEMERSLILTEEFLLLGEMALAAFAEEKKKKGLLDYADLENLALRLVAEKKDGLWQKSELGKRITEEFDAVFVDEYQDSNAIQDLIFRCVTKQDNLFIVGDPKQSIYHFRGAEPEIFSHYKNTLPRYPSEEGSMQTIFLSDNFRCAEPIISLVNRIFRVMMDASSPDSLYKEEDELRCGKGEGADPSPQNTELVLMEKKKEEEKEVLSDAAQLLREENTEANYIASRIRDLLSDYRPEDIAVICRTHRQIALVRESLSALSIPCTAGKDALLSEESEFLFVHSLLLALDNPGGDVVLLGTLLSPVFRFSADDLYRIRKEKKDGNFYSALVFQGEKGKREDLACRCREALGTLAVLREKSKTLSLPALIFHLYRSLSIAELYGKKDRAVKDFFLRCAEASESAGETSLSDFADYAARAAKESPEGDREEPGIRLMTIHKSKGLEYPVVFASFLAQNFDRRDEQAKLILTSELGAAFHLPENGGRARMNTFLRKGSALVLHKAMVQEEKRVLYVALTRAAQKLIITANPRSFSTLKRDLLLVRESPLSPSLTRLLTDHAASPLTMLLLALRDSPAVRHILEEGGGAQDGSLTVALAAPPAPVPYEKHAPQGEEKEKIDPNKILSALNFTYRTEGFDTLPEKLSVSQLLREGREEEALLSPRRLLDFEKGVLQSSAAQIGTATHQVMQFADFDALEKDPEAEFSRLGERGFLSPEDLALVEKEKIAAFFASPLYGRMKASSHVVREKRFNVLLNAMPLLGRPGEVLVQGVVDAWFENPDGTLTLLDFKTDRVKDPDGEKILIRRHGKQLRLYAMAVEEMTGRSVNCLCLFSFSLKREVLIPRDEN